MNRLFYTVFLLIMVAATSAQTNSFFADSIRIKYNIPEIAYAVVSSDSILEIQALGIKRVNTDLNANINDQFRIGSITKTITSYISSILVKQEKIKWETKFFDLYPELKAKSNSAYYDLTLHDFVTFRANLINWSYGNATPTQKEIDGTDKQQRYEFVKWILHQKPDKKKKTIYLSNPSYVAAGLMLEKATGKDYEILVQELGQKLGIRFGFGQPNLNDNNQPWGHDENLIPESPNLNYKLNWLSSAGNIKVNMPDFTKFIQLQLQGLLGKSQMLSSKEFEYMHFGLPEFSFGWKWYVDEKTKLRYSFHEGSSGTFLSKCFICKDMDRAYIIFANVQSEEANKGLMVLLEELKRTF